MTGHFGDGPARPMVVTHLVLTAVHLVCILHVLQSPWRQFFVTIVYSCFNLRVERTVRMKFDKIFHSKPRFPNFEV